MSIFFVADTGSDDAAGSFAAPWRTLAHASAELDPGDTVVVRPGTYVEQIWIGRGGGPTAYVVIRSEIPGAARLRPPEGAYSTLNVRADYVAVEGFDVQGGDGHAIDVENAHHTRIAGNIAHDSGGGGIAFSHSEWIEIEGNHTYGNAATNGWHTSGISVYQARNVSGDATTPGFRIVIRGNISHDNLEREVPGDHTDGNGIIIDDLRSFQSGGPGYPFPTLVENNLVYSNGGKGIQVTWSDNVTVRNNTSWHNNLDPRNEGTWRGELSNAQSSGNTWVNNIAVADPSADPDNTAIGDYAYGDYVNRDVVWRNNITFDGRPGAPSISSTGDWPAASDGNLLGTDPRFADLQDFRPLPGAPGIDAGTGVFGIAAADIAGNPRSVGPIDIGAHEAPFTFQPSGAVDDAVTLDEDDDVLIPVLANDVPGVALDGAGAAAGLAGPAHGRLVIVDEGLYYTPDPDFAGEDRFQYRTRDAAGASSVATVAVTVRAREDPPAARDDGDLVARPGTPLVITPVSLLGNDTDADGDPLELGWVGDAVGGAVTRRAADGAVVFTPAAGAAGFASFRYTVRDTRGEEARATARIRIAARSEPWSFWQPGIRPTEPQASDPYPVELGLEFAARAPGAVAGLRIYCGPGNAGPHPAGLWTADGHLLAAGAFADAGPGWKEMRFTDPVRVEAGARYVAAYHAPLGAYAADLDYFERPLDAGPLTAIGGVYAYGPPGSFPKERFRASNYWIDVIFEPAS